MNSDISLNDDADGTFAVIKQTDGTGLQLDGNGDGAVDVVVSSGSLMVGGVAVTTASSTDTFTNKTLDASATGNVVTIPWIIRTQVARGCNGSTAALGDWSIPSSGPAAAGCVIGSNINKGVMDFADTGGALSMQGTFLLPADTSIAGGLTLRIIWQTTATSGNAKWSVQTASTAVDSTETDDPSYNAADTATVAAPGVASRLVKTDIPLTTTGLAAGELLHLKVSRDGGDAADTIGATARISAVDILLVRAM